MNEEIENFISQITARNRVPKRRLKITMRNCYFPINLQVWSVYLTTVRRATNKLFYCCCFDWFTDNLAFGKPTAQSSTTNFGISGKAVDGNPDTLFRNGHCTHTGFDKSSWWRVDLGPNPLPVSEVHIVNRLSAWFEGSRERKSDYKITVGE